MRLIIIVLLASFYWIDALDQDGSQSSNGQPHIARKLEDYAHDMEHIRHDLEGQVNKPKDEMTLEEQNFYYFKLHDTNNDNRLDGLEVMAAFDHAHSEDANNNTTAEQASQQPRRISDEVLMGLVDDILKEEDLDRDGYISYEEFKHAIEGNAKAQA